MAVEARHINIFSPQLITTAIKTTQGIGDIYNNNTHMDSCVPLVDSIQQQQQQQHHQQQQPLYQSFVCGPNISSAKTSINKADSGLTYNMNIPVSAPTKRSRQDSFNNCFDSYQIPQNNRLFDHDDVFSQIQQQQQQDIDRFISQHSEKVRLELEERRKRQSRVLITAIHERVTKKLKEKDEEIQRIGKLNWVLQERVKSLYMENQLWRDLARTNEATANSLRTNLEQVLAHVSEERHDAESSCGSNDEGWRKVVVVAPPHKAVPAVVVVGENSNDRKCRKCGEKESSVLLLPCRHLCLCTICGSTVVDACPICLSVTNASVHVNMS